MLKELGINKMVSRMVLGSWLCVSMEYTFFTRKGKWSIEKLGVGEEVLDRKGVGTKAACRALRGF